MKLFLHKIVLLIALVGVSNAASPAQTAAKTECPEEKTAKAKTVAFVEAPKAAEAVLVQPAGETTEKAIVTNDKPSISFCVAQGTVRVRGWQRNEVRAMISGGNGLGFRVLRRDGENAATWLSVLGHDPKNSSVKTKCLSGYNVELEVPFGASIVIEGKDEDINIESVAKAGVKNVRGDVVLRDITEKAEVSSLSGSVLAEDSTGEFMLKSTTGSVTANRLKPLNATDALRAFSNGGGNVTLQDVAHTNIESNSLSGNLVIFSPLVSGGNYDLKTTSGNVKLFLPDNSSFQFNATMSRNVTFNTTFPVKTTKQAAPGGSVRVSGTYGAGDATINLTAFSGSILLIKQ